MKKFITLFTMLSCLSVYNAQADVTVWVYGSDPSNQKMYWYNASGTNPAWADSPSFTNLDKDDQNGQPITQEINGDTFYRKTLKRTDNATLTIVLWTKVGNNQYQTSDIPLTGKDEFVFYYFGHNKSGDFTAYYTECPVWINLAGNFHHSENWEQIPFTRNSMTNWTLDLDLTGSDVPNEIQFKFKTNGMTSNDGWIGVGQIGFTYPSGWIEGSDGNNFQFHHSSTGYKKYKLSVTWAPGTDFTAGWSNASIKGDGPFYGQLNMTDDTDLPTSATSVKYTRSVAKDTWGSLCLPFNFNASQSGVTFYQLSNVSTTALTFAPLSGTITAGTPVVFKVTEDDGLSIEESNVTFSSTLSSGVTVGSLTMKGTFTTIQGLNDIYIIQNNEVHPGANITIPPYRAWFAGTLTGAGGAPLRIEVADTENIQFVEQEDGTVKAYYDLQGRKLNERKGLMIENGKVIMVK